MPVELFLPGVSEPLVRAALDRAGGNEIGSGKFANPDSSAALAANGFGWFLERPGDLPPFPPLVDMDWPALSVSVERQMRFPWSGGRHPWLDAAVETRKHIIGVESKRLEPFRGHAAAALSDAYDRDVWGDAMGGYGAMRDRLRAQPKLFAHLDAAQLVKHAYGLVTEGRRVGKVPVLLYLFAEPVEHQLVTPGKLEQHRQEIATFAAAVTGDAVRFAACSWREWLEGFEGEARAHGARLTERYVP